MIWYYMKEFATNPQSSLQIRTRENVNALHINDCQILQCSPPPKAIIQK